MADTPKLLRRGRRTLYLVLAVSIGWKLLVLTLGAAMPKWLVRDGIAELPEAHRNYGTAARQTALALWDKPLERRAIVRGVRVMSVDSVPLASRTPSCALGARVRAYTYFAIPYSEVRTTCDTGVVEYRLFRRR